MKKTKFHRHFHQMKWLKEDYVLPDFYGMDRIVLLLKDPSWLYVYWEMSLNTQEKARNYLSCLILRVYDVTDIIFDGYNASYYWDIPINTFTDNWYIPVKNSNRSYLVELGYNQQGNFISLLRSNSVLTPLDKIAPMFSNYFSGLPEEYSALEAMIEKGMLPFGKHGEKYTYAGSSSGY